MRKSRLSSSWPVPFAGCWHHRPFRLNPIHLSLSNHSSPLSSFGSSSFGSQLDVTPLMKVTHSDNGLHFEVIMNYF